MRHTILEADSCWYNQVLYSAKIGFDASLDLAMAVLQLLACLLACLRTVSVARRHFTENQFVTSISS